MKKKILLIVPRFGSLTRGVETQTDELLRRIDRSRFEVTVLSWRHNRPAEPGVQFVQRPAIPRERLATVYKLRFASRRLSWLLGKLRIDTIYDLEALTLMVSSIPFLVRNRFDIVCPAGGSWSYLISRLFATGSPVVVSVGHAGPVAFDLARSDFFIGVTPHDVERAAALRPGLPSAVIPPGRSRRLTGSSELRPKSGIRTVLTVGALSAEKGHTRLFDAADLLGSGVRVVCLCGGGQDLRPELERHPLARRGAVSFIRATDEELVHWYRSADIFSLATIQETFGLVFLEALAAGLNVVANDGPSHRFVIGESGFYCDVTDKNSYAAALERAIAEPRVTQNLAQAAKFSWDDFVQKHEALFESLTAGKAATGAAHADY